MLVALLGCLAGCSAEPPGRPPAERLQISWQVLAEDSSPEPAFDSVLMISNQSDEILGNDWVLYFNYLLRILPEPPPSGVKIEPINGDFFRIVPGPDFRLERKAEFAVRFRSAGRPVNYSRAPSGFYLVYRDEEGKEAAPAPVESRVLPFPANLLEGAPSAESRYRMAEGLSLLPAERVSPVLPTPVYLRRIPRPVVINSGFQIRYQQGLEQEAGLLADELEKRMGVRLRMAVGEKASHKTIVLRLDRVRVGRPILGSGAQAYGLLTSPFIGIDIVGTDRAGVYYAIQSLRAVLPDGPDPGEPGQITIPGIDIADAPRFRYRGLHLDVARNFRKPETLVKILDLMGFYKLNVLHLHLSDDQGWRLEIPGLPELTGVGGRRGHTLDESDRLIPSLGSGPDPGEGPGSGYFSREEFIDILRQAARRHIRVIPEIDLPGHARAAIRSMEARYLRLAASDPESAERFRLLDPLDQSRYVSVQRWSDNVVNVCQESTYLWIGKVVDEIALMYQEAALRLETFHFGGDEVPAGAWEASPKCRALAPSLPADSPPARQDWSLYFFQRVADLLRERSIQGAGWEEAALALIARATEPGDSAASEQASPPLTAYLWREAAGPETVVQLTRNGFPVVLGNSSHLYFDMAYEPDPAEPGLNWAGFVDTRRSWEFAPLAAFQQRLRELESEKKPGGSQPGTGELRKAESNVLGMQGQLWGELLSSPQRLEYMAFPKLLALAERSWSPAPDWEALGDSEERTRRMQAGWELFANALGQVQLPRLDHWDGGVGYRLPPPGAVVEDGLLKANSIFPGLTIRCSLNGTPVTPESPLCNEPIPLTGSASLATFDSRGRSSRPVTVP